MRNGSLADRDSELSAEGLRVTTPGTVRSSLVTVLGEFVAPYRQPVRTAALLYALTGLGFGESASRQAILRASASGLLTASKDGRETKWQLTEQANQLFVEGARRVFPDDSAGVRWDGRWLIVIAPIPEAQRTARKKMHVALQWAGFGSPSPGVWVTPHADRLAEAQSAIDSLHLTQSTIAFIGSPVSIGISEAEIVARAWDLERVADAYGELLEAFQGRDVDWGRDAFFAHLELADALRRTPYIDPHLPAALVPEWRGLDAVRQLRNLRAEWTAAAHAHWLTIARLD